MKKIVMMRKIEEVNKRKERFMLRKKAEHVQTSISKFGFNEGSPLVNITTHKELEDLKIEIKNMRCESAFHWLRHLRLHIVLSAFAKEFQRRVLIRRAEQEIRRRRMRRISIAKR